MTTKTATDKVAEWRVSVPVEPSSAKSERDSELVTKMRLKLSGFMEKTWRIGADDNRKAVHAVKVGLALSLVSLFYYTRPLYDGVGGSAMWAVMTVVVIFEFNVGGTLYKGLNRAIATLTGGALALGVGFVADKSGKTLEPVILGASVFLLASAATFSRFLPLVRARFDYGITIFILTFSLVSISGYRVDELTMMAQQRLSTIAIGIAICFLVCILICPVWAGEDLHLLIIRNMEKLADSLEGCVAEYFDGNEKKAGPSNKSQAHKCVLNSKTSEDSLYKLATWEPAHGRFGFRHPWKEYLKTGTAMRACGHCLEALTGCINADFQAPEYIKNHFNDVCVKLSSDTAKVLKESSSSIKSMTKSSAMDLLVCNMNSTVEELHTALRTLPSVTTPTSTEATVQFMESLTLITIASLLFEISARVEGVADAVEDLTSAAGFKNADYEESEHPKQANGSTRTVLLQGLQPAMPEIRSKIHSTSLEP